MSATAAANHCHDVAAGFPALSVVEGSLRGILLEGSGGPSAAMLEVMNDYR